MAAGERKAFGVPDDTDLCGIGSWDSDVELDQCVQQQDVQDTEADAASNVCIDAPVHDGEQQQVSFGVAESGEDAKEGIEPRVAPRLDAVEDLISPRYEAFKKGLHRGSSFGLCWGFLFEWMGFYLGRGFLFGMGAFFEGFGMWANDLPLVVEILDMAGFDVGTLLGDEVGADVVCGFFAGLGTLVGDVVATTSEGLFVGAKSVGGF